MPSWVRQENKSSSYSQPAKQQEREEARTVLYDQAVDLYSTSMEQVVNVDGENDDTKLSILTGCHYELNPQLSLHQLWQRLLLTNGNGLREQTALVALDAAGGNSSASTTVTFGQLDERSTELAHQLLSGIHQAPESATDWIIAVCLPPSVELITSLLAIFKLGAAYLPLDPAFPSNRVAHILDDAQPSLLITTTQVLEDTGFHRLLQHNLSVFRYDSPIASLNLVSDHHQDEMMNRHQELAVVLYTSGSTGVPKGVRLTHRNIYHRLTWQWRSLPYDSTEVACFKTALTFVDSIAEIWAPLLMAIPLVIVPKQVTQNPERFITVLDAYKISRLVLVPSLLASIIHYVGNKSKPLQHLRLWVCSGEVLTAQLLRQFYQHLDGKICNFYGSTEVTGDVTYIVFHHREDVDKTLIEGRVPLGMALDNCDVYVLNASGGPVEWGQIGQVFVAGAHIADGYVNGKEMAANFVNNTIKSQKGFDKMYRTGDYGRIVNGLLYYEGRADSQVKVRGHRIDLTEINTALHQLEQVSKGVVLCYKPGQPEQEILAFVVSKKSSASIQKSLFEKLVSYAMPRVVLVDEIPLLVNGKTDRQLLLSTYAKNFKSKPNLCKWNENELNRLDGQVRRVASALFKTIFSVLGGSLHKPLTLSDNYFYVGGNSLNAVIVVTKLRDQGFNLDLTDFLEADNLQQVIAKMEECSKCDGPNNLDMCNTPCYRPTGTGNTNNTFISSDYKIEMLSLSVKDQVIRMMCECFSLKGDLELITGVTYDDYYALVPDLWQPILEANLSFVVKNHRDIVVACGMNCDAFDVPLLQPKVKRLAYVFEVLEFVKGPVREKLVEGKKGHVLQNFLVVTDGFQLTPAENVALVQCVEQETLALAKKNGFSCIFTSNSSPLTQQICNDVLDYKILTEYQVNQFTASDGTQPFNNASDSQLITIGVKYI